jgi:quinol monooxygenase YgiN
MLKIEVGIDFSSSEQSADVVLYSEFADRQALDAYQSHPEHQALMPFVQAVRSDRLVVDYVAPET